MQTLQRTSLLIAAVLLAVTACVIPNVTIIDPVAQATIMAANHRGGHPANSAGGAGHRLRPPSADSSARPSATASETPSPTITPTPTETPTSTCRPRRW